MSLNKKTVVIVDDQFVLRMILSEILNDIEGMELHVLEFEDPKKALDYLMENKVDLILIDYKMPGITGQDLLIELRAHSINKATHIVGMSSDTDKAVLYAFLEATADDFIAKPFDMKETFLRCRNALNRS